MNQPTIIKGGKSTDDRGSVSFVNDFDFHNVKRFYQVENHARGFIRAWHGHKYEGKYIYVPSGTVLVGAVHLESEELTKHVLSANSPQILWIPPNYANGMMTLEEGSIIQVFSTSTLDESLNDDIRIPWDKWHIWKAEYR